MTQISIIRTDEAEVNIEVVVTKKKIDVYIHHDFHANGGKDHINF